MSEEISKKIRTNSDEVVRQFQAMQDEVEKLKQKLKETTQQTKDESRGAADEVANWAASYISVGAAIGIATAGAREYLAEQQRIGDQFDKNNESLTRQLMLTGQLKAGQQAEDFIARTGGDFQKGVAAFTGVAAGSMGSSMSQADRETIAADIMKVSPLIEAADVSALSKFAGSLGKMGFDPTRAGGAAILARQMAGVEADSLMSRKSRASMQNMVGVGFSPEEALAFGVAAASEDLGPKFADSLLEVIGTSEQPGFMTTHGKSKFLREKDGRKRIELLRNNPAIAKEVLGEKKAMEFNREFNAIPSIAAAIAANAAGAADQSVIDARSFESGEAAYTDAGKKTSFQQVDRATVRGTDPYKDAYENIATAVNSRFARSSFLGSPISYLGGLMVKAKFASDLAVDQMIGASPDETLKQFERKASFDKDIMDAFRRNVELDKGLRLEMQTRDRAATVPSRSPHGE